VIRPFHAWSSFCLLFVIALGLASCSAVSGESPTPTPLPAIVSSPENLIFTVERGPIISERDYYGEVVPARQDELFFRSTGFVTRVAAEGGDLIKQGEVIAEMQVDDLLDQLQQARIDLQVAQDNAANEQLQQAYETQKAESDVAILQIQVEQAAQRVEDSYGSQKEDAQRDLEIIQERLQTAQAWLELVKGQKDTSSQAVIERNTLSVERLERLLSERQIIAPYDCIILSRYIRPGMNIDAFSSAFTIGDPTDLVIRIGYEAELAKALEPTTQAFMSLTRTKETTYPVSYLPEFLPVSNDEGGIDTSGGGLARNFFYFSTPESLGFEQLPLGGGVTLTVIMGQKDDAMLLSPLAIRGSDVFRYVIVLEDDYHRRVEVVKVGLKGDKLWEVQADLEAGEQVLGP